MSGPLRYVSTDRELRFFADGAPPSSTLGTPSLVVSKPDGLVAAGQTASDSTGAAARCAAIVGIVRLRLTKYVIVVDDAVESGRILGHPVYRATKFSVLPLREWRVKDDSEAQYLQLLHDHLDSAALFFSYAWDVTNSLQRQWAEPAVAGVPLWKRADDRFFWNKYVSEDLAAAATAEPALSPFIVPMINGVVSLRETSILGQAVTFGIISRRSRFRAGTRYFRRGIDEDGNVANFNETEQLLVVHSTKQRVYSFLQTRGSVPTFWAEINNLRYKPLLRIDKETSPVPSARRHFTQQTDLYGKNYLVNLVNQKGYEKPVKDSYESVVQNLKDDKLGPLLEYIYFDFHHECSKMRWHRVNVLIERLEQVGLDDQRWFSVDLEDGDASSVRVLDKQTSVVRTNCMDCLDRTNVVQSQLARWVLQRQLQDAGVLGDKEGTHWDSDKNFLFQFRNAWADNADGVSCAYSGTGALKTDFTRLGKRTKMGALNDLRNSIVRYFKNNLADGPRQDGYDLFLGNHLPHETVVAPFFDSRPIFIQSAPYLFLGSLVLALALLLFPSADSPRLLSRIVLLLSLLLLIITFRSFATQGLQYVNWPRLCGLRFVTRRQDAAQKGWVIVERPAHELRARSLDEEKIE